MSRLIDKHGNLFGIVNIIDLLVLLLLVAILTAACALFGRQSISTSLLARDPTTIVAGVTVTGVLGAFLVRSAISTPTKQVADVELLINAPAFVLDSVPDVAESSDVVVNDVGDTVSLTVPVTFTDPTKIHYNGNRLYLGNEMTVDLGRIILTGTIVSLSEGYRTELE